MKSTSRMQTWSVGEVAVRFAIATHVLRHWEAVGLLSPMRDSAGRRRYVQADIVRVAVVLRSKAAGMSLEQIQTLLDGGAGSRHEVLYAHIADLDRRMDEMARSREMTLHAVRCRAHDIATCPHFRAGVDDIVNGGTWPHGAETEKRTRRAGGAGSLPGLAGAEPADGRRLSDGI